MKQKVKAFEWGKDLFTYIYIEDNSLVIRTHDDTNGEVINNTRITFGTDVKVEVASEEP